MGVKQGDCISATLFSIYINDLANEIKDSKIGINLTEKVTNDEFLDDYKDLFLNILLYADDIILLAANENDLQSLLYIVEKWGKKWRLESNLAESE